MTALVKHDILRAKLRRLRRLRSYETTHLQVRTTRAQGAALAQPHHPLERGDAWRPGRGVCGSVACLGVARTPFNAIRGYVQALEMGLAEPGHRRHLQHILGAGRHLFGLVAELLDITRIEAVQGSIDQPRSVAANRLPSITAVSATDTPKDRTLR